MSGLIGEVVFFGKTYLIQPLTSLEDQGYINACFNARRDSVELSDAARALPRHIQLAIIGHELGHKVHEHWRCRYRSLENEIEADYSACKIAGVDAVRQLLHILIRSCERADCETDELQARLAALPLTPRRENPQGRIPSRRRKKGRRRRTR